VTSLRMGGEKGIGTRWVHRIRAGCRRSYYLSALNLLRRMMSDLRPVRQRRIDRVDFFSLDCCGCL